MDSNFTVFPHGWFTRLLHSLDASGTKILIVSPYLGLTPLKKVYKAVECNNRRIRVLSRLSEKDIADGATSFDAIEFCQKNGIEYGVLENIHAKAYIVTRPLRKVTAFVGSGNLTDRGTGCDKKGIINQELAVRVVDGDEASAVSEAMEKWWKTGLNNPATSLLHSSEWMAARRAGLMMQKQLDYLTQGLVTVTLTTRAGAIQHRFNPKMLVSGHDDLSIWQELTKTGLPLLKGKDLEDLRNLVVGVQAEFQKLTQQTPWGSVMRAGDVDALEMRIRKIQERVERRWYNIVGNDPVGKLEMRLRRHLGREIDVLLKDGTGSGTKRRQEFWDEVRSDLHRITDNGHIPIWASVAFQNLVPLHARADQIDSLADARTKLFHPREKTSAIVEPELRFQDEDEQ